MQILVSQLAGIKNGQEINPTVVSMIEHIGIQFELIRAGRVLPGGRITTDHVSFVDVAHLEYLMGHMIETETMGWQMGDWVVAVCYADFLGFAQVLVIPFAEFGVAYPWGPICVHQLYIDTLVFEADGSVAGQGASQTVPYYSTIRGTSTSGTRFDIYRGII